MDINILCYQIKMQELLIKYLLKGYSYQESERKAILEFEEELYLNE